MLMEARYVKDEKRQTCRAQKGTGLKSETWKNYSKGRTYSFQSQGVCL